MEELVLTSSEIDTLINWHIDQKYECASKEEYNDAENHRIRALKLQEYLQYRGTLQVPKRMT